MGGLEEVAGDCMMALEEWPAHCSTLSPVMKAPGCRMVQGHCQIGWLVGCKRGLACCMLGAPERYKTVLELAGCSQAWLGLVGVFEVALMEGLFRVIK